MFTAFSFFIPVITGNDPDAQAFIDATGISGTDATAINNLVVELKNNSLWTKMKVIYPMVGGTSDTMKYNLVDPQDTDAAYRITWNGTNTFDANGVTFGGTTADYGNMHLIPSSSGIDLNSGHLSFYNRVNQTIGGCYMGIRDSAAPLNSSQIFVNSLTPISASFSGWCGPAILNRGTLSDTKGYILTSRTTSTLDETYVDGTLEITYTGTSTALSPLKMLIGARNFGASGITPNQPTNTNCAFASVGDGLSSSEVSTLYTIVQDFQTELGRQI